MMDLSYFPIRCYTCGKPISQYAEQYFQLIKLGENPQTLFNRFHIRRYCCRTLFLTYVPLPSGYLPQNNPSIAPNIEIGAYPPLDMDNLNRDIKGKVETSRGFQPSIHGYVVPYQPHVYKAV